MSDLIDRQAALEAMDTWDKFGCDPDGKLVRYDDDKHYVPYVHFDDMVHAIKHLPSAQPEKRTEERTETHGVCLDAISRQAVQYLDLFTKTYCRDKTVTDDLVFRCSECEFKTRGGICRVKCMARRLCPDYKDFGSMGDL